MEHNNLLKSYTIGFIFSIVLTLAAYFAVVNHLLSGTPLVACIIVLALVQLVIQLIFFLHLSLKQPWNLAIFLGTVSIILVLVIGAIWIMNNLNYNMTPRQMEQYVQSQDGF